MEKLISTGAMYSILDALGKITSFDGCMYGDVVGFNFAGLRAFLSG